MVHVSGIVEERPPWGIAEDTSDPGYGTLDVVYFGGVSTDDLESATGGLSNVLICRHLQLYRNDARSMGALCRR